MGDVVKPERVIDTRKHNGVYTEDFKLHVARRVLAGEDVAEVAKDCGIRYNTAWRWCQERGVLYRGTRAQVRELVVWVPTNRRDEDYEPTHMDGWNEIVNEYKRSRYHGSKREMTNVEYVASYVTEAMAKQGWAAMVDVASAVPCSVTILFVERDRRRDVGNIHGGAKYALDALTHRHPRGASAIYDDAQRWLPEIHYIIDVDADRPGMRITVRELERREG